MERSQALDAIRSVAAEVLGIDAAGIAETARFREDLEADSLHLVELVMGLEDTFDIQVPEDDLEGVATIADAVDLVLARLA